MGWLDKFRKQGDGDDGSPGKPRTSATGPLGEPGPLTDADRSEIGRMIQQEFAGRGREVVPDGTGSFRGVDGRHFGTVNLEEALRRIPREGWSAAVAEHVRILSSTIDSPEPGSLAEVRDRVYLRLRREADLPQPLTYHSPVLPGIVGLVAIDHPEHTEELSGIDSLGTWDEIRPLAIKNIRGLQPMRHHVASADASRADAAIHVFDTDDFFGPSRILALDQLTDAIGGQRSPHGLLAVIPNRHVIALHEISGPGTMAAITGLVNLVLTQFHERPGALSPDVFYLGAGGHHQQVTRQSEGKVQVHIDGALAETFARIGIGGS